MPNLEPGTYAVTVTMTGSGPHRARPPAPPRRHRHARAQDAGGRVEENLVVTAESPLVERSSNQIGGSLSRREIEEVPLELPQLHRADAAHPRHDAQPGAVDLRRRRWWPTGRRPSRTSACSTAYNNDDRPRRQPGRGARGARQHRGAQVLANQYSASAAAAPAPSSTW
ncbi:MAG: hypothetical protein R2712_06015 [Vicinamibacterales bacterium]